jgi:threonyl-tRNA synthetase
MSDSNLETLRHSASHILAAAVLDMFPEAKLGTGPATADGFYYDFQLPRSLIPEDLPLLEKKMKHLIKQNQKFERSEEPIEQAREFFQKLGQNFKVEIIDELEKKGETVASFYKNGNFVDLCAGPHIDNTNKLKAFKLTKISGSYWRGDAERPAMQRIYGVAFDSAEELASWEKLLEEAKKRDHRELGKKLQLFSFHEESPGAAFWHPRGKFLYDAVVGYMRAQNEARGYEEVMTPIVLSSELWKRSGHYDNFKENMYFTQFEERELAVKPMNCPGGCLMFGERLPSYRELPIKAAEFGTVHRLELSGVLHGLLRVRQFTQDDAHVFCTPDQLQAEIEAIVEYTLAVYQHFGFNDFELFIATRPEKSLGSDEIWEKATSALEGALTARKMDFKVKAGEGAFYGPKIEFNVKDALGRNWQLGTCQVDFSMPARFELSYIGEDGEKHQPVMLHRAIVGSLERFIGVLIEHTGGALPAWLCAEQARFIPVAQEFIPVCEEMAAELKKAGIRAIVDASTDSLGKKVRNGEQMKIPYLLVVGEKEAQAKSVTVRERLPAGRQGEPEAQETLTVAEFVKKLLA